MILIKEAHENKIANSKKYFYDEILSQENILKDIEGLIENVLNEKREIQYEELSMKIYNFLDQLEDINEEIKSKNNEKINYEDKLKLAVKEKNILRCAEIYGNYKYISEELLKVENKIKVLKDEQGDKEPRINDLGFSILNLLNIEINKLKEELELLEKENSNLNSKEINLSTSLKKNRTFENDLNKKLGSLKAIVNSYNKIEERFNKKYNENLSRNITGYYNDEDLLRLSKEIINSIESINKNRITEEKRYFDLNEEIKALSSENEKLKAKLKIMK